MKHYILAIIFSISTAYAQCPPNTDWDGANCAVAYCTEGEPFHLYGNWYCPQTAGDLWGNCISGGKRVIYLNSGNPVGKYDGSNCHVSIPAGCETVGKFQWGIYCAPQAPQNNCGRARNIDYHLPGHTPSNWVLYTKAGQDIFRHKNLNIERKATNCPDGCGPIIDSVGQQDWCIQGATSSNDRNLWGYFRDIIKNDVPSVTQGTQNQINGILNTIKSVTSQFVNFTVGTLQQVKSLTEKVVSYVVNQTFGRIWDLFQSSELPEPNLSPIDTYYRSEDAKRNCQVADSRTLPDIEPPLFTGWRRYRMGHVASTTSKKIVSRFIDENSMGYSYEFSEGALPINGSNYTTWNCSELSPSGVNLTSLPEITSFSVKNGFSRKVFFNKSVFWNPAKVPHTPHPTDPAFLTGEKLEGKLTGFVDCGTPGKSNQTDFTAAHDNSARFTFDLMTVNSFSDNVWGGHDSQQAQTNFSISQDGRNSVFTGCVGIYGYAYWNGIGPSNEEARVPPMFLGMIPVNQQHDLKIKVTKAHPSLKPLKYVIQKIFPTAIPVANLSCGNSCVKGDVIQHDIDQDGKLNTCNVHKVNNHGSFKTANLRCYAEVSESFESQYEFYINDRLVGRMPRGKNLKSPLKCQKTLLRPYFGGDDPWTVGTSLQTPEVHSCLALPGNTTGFNGRSFDVFLKK